MIQFDGEYWLYAGIAILGIVGLIGVAFLSPTNHQEHDHSS